MARCIHNLGLDGDLIQGRKSPDLRVFEKTAWPAMHNSTRQYSRHIEKDNFEGANSILNLLVVSVHAYLEAFGLPVRIEIFGGLKVIHLHFRDAFQYAGAQDFQLRFYGNGYEAYMRCERLWESVGGDRATAGGHAGADGKVEGPVSPGLIRLLVKSFLKVQKFCENETKQAIKEREALEEQVERCESELR